MDRARYRVGRCGRSIKQRTLIEALIESCEQCNPEGAEWPFKALLDRGHRFRSERDGLRSGAAGEVPELLE
jgi:hypothetical protein